MFPGQGAQQMGMGSDLVKADTEIADLYRKANEIVGYDLAKICFEGPTERLDTTEIAQPAIFVTSAACLKILRDGKAGTHLANLQPHACIGLSLGEYTALYAAGALSFEEGLKLVQIRGKSMQAAADAQSGTMVTILGATPEQAQQLCDAVLSDAPAEADGSEPLLVPVNFNCPGQIVLSGSINACQAAAERAEQFGATKAIVLRVAGAFHTKMMDPAAENLGLALKQCSFTPFNCPVIANADAALYESTDQIPQKLLKQLVSPVLWQPTLDKLLDDGVDTFVEIGPGRVLTGLAKKTARDRKAKPNLFTVNGPE